MLVFVLLLQMGSTAVQGIISSQPTQPANATSVKFEDNPLFPRYVRKINATPSKNVSWKTVLKDATFQSLIKHTALTPSLDEKIESDRLLWEKLQAAKFLRKPNGKPDESNEQMRMGVLVDMTKDGGSLEFRQSDKSVYTCPDKCEDVLRRLLAVWKLERFDPNDTWIRVKVPRYNQNEDVYEFTPKHGLQQMNTRFAPKGNGTTGRSLRNSTAGNEEINNRPVLDERSNRRMDFGALEPHRMTFYEMKHYRAKDFPGSKQRIQFPQNYGPYVVSQKVLQPIHINQRGTTYKNVFYQMQPIQPKVMIVEHELVRDFSTIKVEPKILREFQRVKDPYNGFLPSVGPTGSPATSTVQMSLPESPQRYEMSRVPESLPTRFKGSTKLEQFSELDPVYHNDGGSVFVHREAEIEKTRAVDLSTESIAKPTVGSTKAPLSWSSQENYDDIEGSWSSEEGRTQTTVESGTEESTELYIGDKSKKEEFSGESTKSSLGSTESDTERNTESSSSWYEEDTSSTEPVQQVTTIFEISPDEKLEQTEGSMRVSKVIDMTGNEIQLTTKSTAKKRKLGNDTNSAEALDYAPLYAHWGEKLRPQESTAITEPPRQLKPSAESRKSFPKANPVTLTSGKTNNMYIDDIENRSPEEVVNMLTDIGVKHSSRIEGYPPVSEATLEASSKILDKIQSSGKPSESDPISLIVNRISQSYSYKTSSGKTSNFRKMRGRRL